MRESESDSDSESGSRNKLDPKVTKKTASAPVSPKQTQARSATAQQEQPINLLKTSILTSQKKSPKPATSHKRIENELETALSEVHFLYSLVLFFLYLCFNLI